MVSLDVEDPDLAISRSGLELSASRDVVRDSLRKKEHFPMQPQNATDRPGRNGLLQKSIKKEHINISMVIEGSAGA